MKNKQILNEEAYRYSRLNHQQYGHLIGMIMGLGFGFYVAINYDNTKPSWIMDGTLTDTNWYFNEAVRACIVPLTSGLFANLFSNMGAGIDVLTNQKTLLSFIVDKCGKKISIEILYSLILIILKLKIAVLKSMRNCYSEQIFKLIINH